MFVCAFSELYFFSHVSLAISHTFFLCKDDGESTFSCFNCEWFFIVLYLFNKLLIQLRHFTIDFYNNKEGKYRLWLSQGTFAWRSEGDKGKLRSAQREPPPSIQLSTNGATASWSYCRNEEIVGFK